MNKNRIIVFLVFFILLYHNVNGVNNLYQIKKIDWGNEIKENNRKVIIGRVSESFGSFEFRWIVEGERIRLIYLEPVGSGILPPVERELYIMNLKEGVSLIFQKWIPLVNQSEPESLRLITTVKTEELFSVLPIKREIKSIKPPEGIAKLKWENKIIKKDREKVLTGNLLSNKKRFKIIIKKLDKQIVLNLFDEKKRDINIIPWFYEDIVYICEVNDNNVIPITKIKRKELQEGFKNF